MKKAKTLALWASIAALIPISSWGAFSGGNPGGMVPTRPAGEARTGIQRYSLPVLSVRQRLTGQSRGQCMYLPLEIAIGKGKAPLRVSFSDDTPNGSGDSIRNSLWMAALTAALQKESALEGVRISIDFKGGIDGPSAGAVMCLGIMSALDGRPFPEDFAMTGAVLPDGTVGLVGGVPEKLRAAAATGKIRRVAIPAFQRFARDQEGNYVDLFELGTELGLEVHPVQSIDEAYRFMHGDPTPAKPVLSALDICREDADAEAAAAAAFLDRDAALWGRLNGLESNTYAEVEGSWVWNDYINPRLAEERFEQGALHDALQLVGKADAALSAYQESCRMLDATRAYFFDGEQENPQEATTTNGGALVKMYDATRGYLSKVVQGKPLAEMSMDEWPLEKQLAFVDTFRTVVETYCERNLGWETESAEEDAEEKGPDTGDGKWTGYIPGPGESDVLAQSVSALDITRAQGQYLFMCGQTVDREQLPAMIESGERMSTEEIVYDWKKLFFLLYALQGGKGADAAVSPTYQAGPEVEAVGALFWKSWQTVDHMLETDIVEDFAEVAGVHRENVRTYLLGTDLDYAEYLAAKEFGATVHRLMQDAEDDGTEMPYPSYTRSVLLFVDVDLFAAASARWLDMDGELENASFAAFVVDRAREEALRSMAACRAAGIPYFGAVSAFQTAERNRAISGNSATEVLANYWKATMTAKALIMAFRNGNGPEQGFSGYVLPELETAAVAAFGAWLNADSAPFLATLPESWKDDLSGIAAEVAARVDDETWNAFLKTVGAAGVLGIRQGVRIAEACEGGDYAFLPEEARSRQTVVENWGRRLFTLGLTATRQDVASGRLEEILVMPKRRLQGFENAGGKLRLPHLRYISLPDNKIRIVGEGTGEIDFVNHDGKWVPDGFAELFATCHDFRGKSAEFFDNPDLWDVGQIRDFLKTLGRGLRKAALAETPNEFSEAFESIF